MADEILFRLDLQVRDYECDLQGIVNNAVYQHYLEHTRHEFLKSRGLEFAKLSKEGVNLVVVRAELEYRKSLFPGDRFQVDLALESEGRVRQVFRQSIHRDNGDLILDARIVWTALDSRGRPRMPESLMSVLLPRSPSPEA